MRHGPHVMAAHPYPVPAHSARGSPGALYRYWLLAGKSCLLMLAALSLFQIGLSSLSWMLDCGCPDTASNLASGICGLAAAAAGFVSFPFFQSMPSLRGRCQRPRAGI